MEYGLVGEEVYVIFEDWDHVVDIVFCDDLPDAFEYLKLLPPNEFFDTIALHGVLTKAESIPADLISRECFIIIVQPESYQNSAGLKGAVIESDAGDSVEVLAEEIEEVINKGGKWDNGIDIEDVFILYGYRIELGICVNEDSIDEENIETCKRVSEAAEAIIENAPKVRIYHDG
jgi:hypothetical protein